MLCTWLTEKLDFEGCIWKKGAVQWPRAAWRLGHMPKPKGRARACLLTHLGSFRNTRHSSYTQTSKHDKLACIHSMEVHHCLLRKRKGWLSKCSTCKLCLLGFIMGVHSYKCAYALEDIYFLLLLMIFIRECGGKTHYLTVSYFPLLNRTRLFCLLSLSDLSSAWQLVAQVLVATGSHLIRHRWRTLHSTYIAMPFIKLWKCKVGNYFLRWF